MKRLLIAAACTLLLSACGGADDAPAPSSSNAASSLSSTQSLASSSIVVSSSVQASSDANTSPASSLARSSVSSSVNSSVNSADILSSSSIRSSLSASSERSSSSRSSSPAVVALKPTRFIFDKNIPLFTDFSPPENLAFSAGNAGATLGEQRLIAFEHALGIIESELRISQTISIVFPESDFQDCSVFASASYQSSWRNAGGFVPDILYPTALANEILNRNTSGADEIWVKFNERLFSGQCSRNLYYGLNGDPADIETVDFLDLVLHELSHGLGIIANTSDNTGDSTIWSYFNYSPALAMRYTDMTIAQRTTARQTQKSLVFSGRMARAAFEQYADKDIFLSLNINNAPLYFNINPVLGSPSLLPDEVLRAPLVFLDFNTCEPPSNISGAIILLPSGCARVELGFAGNMTNSILRAQAAGALAVVVSHGYSLERHGSYELLEVPVFSVLFDDYQRLQSAAGDQRPNASIWQHTQSIAGVDSLGRPYLVGGPDMADGRTSHHWDGDARLLPIVPGAESPRALMNPIISRTGYEPVRHSLGLNIAALVDMGWAAKTCGNGQLDAWEECDDGNIVNGDACTQNCLLPGSCGDGIVLSPVEQCDDGLSNNDQTPNACRTTCQRPYCGDGIIDNGEQCDNGRLNNNQPLSLCSLSCQAL